MPPKDAGGGQALSWTLVLGFTLAGSLLGPVSAFLVPWYYQMLYTPFAGQYRADRVFSLLKWSDKFMSAIDIREYKKETCDANGRYIAQAIGAKAMTVAIVNAKIRDGLRKMQGGKCNDICPSEDAPEEEEAEATPSADTGADAGADAGGKAEGDKGDKSLIQARAELGSAEPAADDKADNKDNPDEKADEKAAPTTYKPVGTAKDPFDADCAKQINKERFDKAMSKGATAGPKCIVAIMGLPLWTDGCGSFESCVKATTLRCQLYKIYVPMALVSAGCFSFAGLVGIIAAIYLFMESWAGKKKSALKEARMKTLVCVGLSWFFTFIATIIASYGWYRMITAIRSVQIWPATAPYVGCWLACGAVFLLTVSFFLAIDRFHPQVWETCCPCLRKGEAQVSPTGGEGEFYYAEGDPNAGYGDAYAAGGYGMGGGADMYGAGYGGQAPTYN